MATSGAPPDSGPCSVTVTDATKSQKIPSFPFDVVFVFNGRAAGGAAFAKNFYNDLHHDGFFVCHYDKHSHNGMHRIFVGVGASDRLLHALCTTFHLSEEYQEVHDENGLKRIYAQTSRQRIIYRIVKLRSYGGPHASLENLSETGIMMDHFCLHDPKEVEDILAANRKYWLFPTSDYINDIETYFGEEFAFFIAWLRSIVIFTLPLMVLYVILFAFQLSDSYKSWSMIVAGIVCPCYLQVMHENWKRMEKELAMEFGTLDYEYSAEVQPSFHGRPRRLQWTAEKVIEREGEGSTTIIVPGDFQLPIQHTFPIHKKAASQEHHVKKLIAKERNPFDMTVVTSVDVDNLPADVNEIYYPNWKRLIKLAVVVPTVICFTVAVIVAIYLIEILRNLFADPNTGQLSPNMSIAASVINSVAIVVLNQVYPIVARKLAEWQNFRTSQETEDSYIFKIFVFVFVNSYFPIYLTAFDLYILRQSNLDKRAADDKTQQLFVQLLTAAISTVIVSNIIHVAVPFFLGPLFEYFSALAERCKGRLRFDTQVEAIDAPSPTTTTVPGKPFLGRFSTVTQAERVFEHQIKQAACSPIFPRFQGRIILLGFAAIFATVFPLGMVFVVVDAAIVMRLEIVRYLLLMRRGLAKQVDSIGNWKMCIQFIIIAAAITNCLLMAFVTDSLPQWFALTADYDHRVRWFIAAEHAMLAFIFAIEYLIPDMPMSIRRIQALQAYAELQKAGRVHYDPIDLHMPKSKILMDIHSTEQQNDKCAVCQVPFVKNDVIRMFPCLHAIHDSCLNRFIEEHKDQQHNEALDRTVHLTDDVKQAKLKEGAISHEVVCNCPICHYDIDCRFFDKRGTLHDYVPIRFQITKMILSERSKKHAAHLANTIEGEHRLLMAHGAQFGILENAFPDPGPEPEATLAAEESKKFEQIIGGTSSDSEESEEAFEDAGKQFTPKEPAEDTAEAAKAAEEK